MPAVYALLRARPRRQRRLLLATMQVRRSVCAETCGHEAPAQTRPAPCCGGGEVMRDETDIRARLAALPRLLTLKQAAEELGLRLSTLRTAIWNGELAQVRLGRSVRVKREDLEAWLSRNTFRGPVL